MNKKTLKSIGAVTAGMLAGIILTLGTDELLHLAGVFPPWGQPAGDGPLVLATVYRAIYNVAGGYIAARLAPDRPMWHALAGGVVGLVLCTVGAVATWNRGPAFGPHWYPVALIVIAMPCAWVGGVLHRSRGAERTHEPLNFSTLLKK
jgi:peptidoglycan/LPS O-acetylase OafA/YrhL